jgi:hypothetical protein
VGYSVITRYLWRQSFPHSSEVTEIEAEIESSDIIDCAILHTLNKPPFAPLQQLAKRILIPATTIRYHLVNKMWYTIKHCKWIPRRLSVAQKQKHKETRVTASTCFSDSLHSLQHQDWKYIVTLDEV